MAKKQRLSIMKPTPDPDNILQFLICLPLGMVMQLKRAVGEQFILSREHKLMEKARQKLSKLENFVLLGNALNGDSCCYLPVMSFVIRAPPFGGFLHHNFVCALLNDLFGIQARGGMQIFRF